MNRNRTRAALSGCSPHFSSFFRRFFAFFGLSISITMLRSSLPLRRLRRRRSMPMVAISFSANFVSGIASLCRNASTDFPNFRRMDSVSIRKKHRMQKKAVRTAATSTAPRRVFRWSFTHAICVFDTQTEATTVAINAANHARHTDIYRLSNVCQTSRNPLDVSSFRRSGLSRSDRRILSVCSVPSGFPLCGFSAFAGFCLTGRCRGRNLSAFFLQTAASSTASPYCGMRENSANASSNSL